MSKFTLCKPYMPKEKKEPILGVLRIEFPHSGCPSREWKDCPKSDVRVITKYWEQNVASPMVYAFTPHIPIEYKKSALEVILG